MEPDVVEIKTAQERNRLDEIFAEVEAYESQQFNADAIAYKSQQQRDEANAKAKIERLKQENPSAMYGMAKQMLASGGLKTKWEIVLADAYTKLYEDKVNVSKVKRKSERMDYGAVRAELEVYRNFVIAVQKRLDNAEKSAREQDNHHYYKIFAEGVKTLLDKL